MENMLDQAVYFLKTFGFDLLIAIIIFLVGRFVAKMLQGISVKLMNKKQVDEAVVSFTADLIYTILLIFVILAALSKMGIETTSFIAILGAAGLAIGLALQGSLSNFAAGVLLLIFKPFRVGHFIDAAGVSGSVEKIQVFTTTLKSVDNKKIIVPNSKLIGDNIINYSANDTRRVDFVFGIGYGDDIKKAKEILQRLINEDSRVLKDPAPTIAVSELGDSSVNIVCRPWVKTSDYWNLYFDITEKVKLTFDNENISIPFPQRDVHLYKHDA